MNLKDPMGSRFKKYEAVSDYYLTRRVPVIARIDGRAFHSVTKNMNKPFDERFIRAMLLTGLELCHQIQGAKFAYVQSDEISILMTDYDKLDTEPWFDYRINKMCSIGGSIASNEFRNHMAVDVEFDARFFNVPKEDVCNYFLWRQRDFTKNSIQMVAQANFPHKSIQNLNCSQLQEKLFKEKNINWDEMLTRHKRGIAIYKADDVWFADYSTPIFGQDRNFVEKWLEAKDDNLTDKNPFGY